jgi:outer membrane lipoprotein-sorting protein
MKKGLLLFAAGLFLAGPVRADAEADSLMKCVENSGLGQASGFKFKQVIKREGQAPRKYQAECYLANRAEKLLIKFEDPADMAGMKLLLKEQGKQMWTYFPSSNRVRKMAGASSGQQIGSLGFSYDDLFPYLEGEDYNTKVVGENKVSGQACKVVEVVHKSGGTTTYKKSQVSIDAENCLLRQSQFFGEKNRLLKTVHFSKYQKVEGRNIPVQITITQPDLGEESNITVLAVEFEQDYGSTFFSELSLKR